MTILENVYKSDCKFFRGDLPCKPHKEFNVKCNNCNYYSPFEDIILIIKLGALGDVIRTSPLIHKIRKEYPKSAIWWISYSPDVVPNSVEKKLKYTPESMMILQATKFVKIINLDKDEPACALTNLLIADEKIGFHLLNGKPAPINKLAEHKFLTGLFDDVNKANTKSYLEEIFEICGWQFEGEEYILDCTSSIEWKINNNGKKIIGLNTGCGDRWVSRLWYDENWIELINRLKAKDYHPLLLGGKQEDEKNKYFAEKTNAEYIGYFPLQDFISLVDKCDLIVSAVTMGMHIAMGLKKPLVLMNNIFNKYEFEMYGRGEIIEPENKCQCFFSATCTNKEYKCMDSLSVDMIYNSIIKNIS